MRGPAIDWFASPKETCTYPKAFSYIILFFKPNALGKTSTYKSYIFLLPRACYKISEILLLAQSLSWRFPSSCAQQSIIRNTWLLSSCNWFPHYCGHIPKKWYTSKKGLSQNKAGILQTKTNLEICCCTYPALTLQLGSESQTKTSGSCGDTLSLRQWGGTVRATDIPFWPFTAVQ